MKSQVLRGEDPRLVEARDCVRDVGPSYLHPIGVYSDGGWRGKRITVDTARVPYAASAKLREAYRAAIRASGHPYQARAELGGGLSWPYGDGSGATPADAMRAAATDLTRTAERGLIEAREAVERAAERVRKAQTTARAIHKVADALEQGDEPEDGEG